MTARSNYESVEDYIAAQPLAARAALQRVRAAIRKALPAATEGISYRIPVYKLDGRMVLYFAGFENHYSIYPATDGVISALGEALSRRLHSKATIRFSYTDAVPTRLISRIAKVRAAEAAEAKTEQKKQSAVKTRSKASGRKAAVKRVRKR